MGDMATFYNKKRLWLSTFFRRSLKKPKNILAANHAKGVTPSAEVSQIILDKVFSFW